MQMHFAGSDFWTVGGFFEARLALPAGNIGFMPYIRGGINFIHDQEYDNFSETSSGFPFAVMMQAGLRVTSTTVPGLFIGTSFQYFHSLQDSDFDNRLRMALAITAGFAF